VPPEGATGPFDLGLFLDCADVDRIGSAQSLVPSLPEIINIDDHLSNRGYGTMNLIDASAGACGEIAVRLIDALGWQLDGEAATALFTALATDTGSFRFENTHPDTLRTAARLVEAGADVAKVSREVWDSRSLASLNLLSLVLPTLRVEGGGRLASLAITQAMVQEAGAVAGDLEGLVDYPRSLRGVEVAMLCTEDRSGSIRVSLRSSRWVDVSQLAARFGGGGHVRAAGCTVPGALDEVRDRVGQAALEALAAVDAAPQA
jgi:phosphoesterase RecJ-like protein